MYYHEKFKDINKMSKEELKEELQAWRNLWTWVDDDTKYYLSKIGQNVAVITRNYKRYIGRMLSPKFELKEIEIETIVKEFNYEDGNYCLEYKTVRIPISNIVGFEVISERELVEQQEEAKVASSISEEVEDVMKKLEGGEVNGENA